MVVNLTFDAKVRCVPGTFSTTLDIVEKAIDLVESSLGAITEIHPGRTHAARLYKFPSNSTAKAMNLVYPDAWGFTHNKFSSAGGRHGTEGLDSFIVATHILRAGWYAAAAADCHKTHAAGQACEALSLRQTASTDTAAQLGWKRLHTRLQAALVKVSKHVLPELETRKDAQAAHDERRAAMMTQASGKAEPAAPVPLANDSAPVEPEPAGESVTFAPVQFDLGPVPDEESDVEDFQDPDLRVPKAGPEPLLPRAVKLLEVAPLNVKDLFGQLQLGAASNLIVDAVQEMTPDGGLVTRVRITRGLSENGMLQVHRNQSLRSLSGVSKGNEVVNPGSIAGAYRQLGATGGGFRTALPLMLTEKQAASLTETEFGQLRQAFYHLVRTPKRITEALGPGWGFDKVYQTNADGTQGAVLTDDLNETVYHAFEVKP